MKALSSVTTGIHNAEKTSGGTPPTVVLADDNSVIRLFAKGLLEQEGWSCVAADNGRLALTTIRSTRPAAAILDVDMPYMGGLEVLARLQESPLTRGIPVMVLSGYCEPEIVAKSFRLGAKDFVAKPFQRANLIERLRPLLS